MFLRNDDTDRGDVVTGAGDDISEPTWRVILFIHEPISIWTQDKKWRDATNKLLIRMANDYPPASLKL